MSEIAEEQHSEEPVVGDEAPVVVALKEDAEDVFRGLWASLFYSAGTVGKTVLICAANRNEGVTTIASGLALAGSIPEGIARVALVDFNLRKPGLHEVFDLERNLGVSEMVLDGVAPEIAAQSITEGLDVFTAGTANERILEILRNEAITGLFEQLSAKYDRVLVDVPAVNLHADAQVLAGIARDVVLVARTDQTPREAVAMAKKRLEGAGGHIVGTVLNLRSYPIPRFVYRRV